MQYRELRGWCQESPPYLTVEVGFRGFRGIQLQTLPDTLPKDMASGICLHDLRHGLLNKWFHAREPIAIGRPQIVRKIHSNHDTCG